MIKKEFTHICVNKYNKEIYVSDYDYLLNYLQSILTIDKKIIHNLIELNKLHYVANNIKIVKDNNKDLYIIGRNCSLRENYEKQKSYILAYYLLVDNNFEIKKDYEGTYNQENYLLNKNNKFNMLIKEHKELNRIALLIELEENVLIPYNIDILNENEREQLMHTIILQKSYLYDDLGRISGKYYALFFINIIKEKSLIQNINSMNNQIRYTYLDFSEKVNKYREDNKLIFERALTEIQIGNF